MACDASPNSLCHSSCSRPLGLVQVCGEWFVTFYMAQSVTGYGFGLILLGLKVYLLGTWPGTLSRAENVTAHAGGLFQCRVY